MALAPPPKENVKFSVGDKVRLKPVSLTNITDKIDQGKELYPQEEDIINYPYLTVTEVKDNGSFHYKEFNHPGHKCPWMLEQAFELVNENQFTDLTVEGKKQFIKEVVGSLYKDGHIYSKIKQLINNP